MSTFRPYYGSRAGIQVRGVRGQWPEIQRVTPRTRVWSGPGTRFTDDIRAAAEKKARANKTSTDLGATPLVAAANLRVQRESAGYRLPQPARTTSQAIRAMVLILDLAASEAPKRAAVFRKVAAQAPYAYSTYSPFQVLVLARQTVAMGGTPKAAAMAQQVLRATGHGTVSKKPADPAPSTPGDATLDPNSAPAAPADPVSTFLARLPSWAPWAALAVGGLIVAGIAFRPRALMVLGGQHAG